MPFTTEAAVLTANSGSRCELQPLIVPDPGPQEMIVELRACGICHTDLGFAAHVTRPAVLGHEGAGVVSQVGERVTRFAPGDRVVLTFSACEQCPTCTSGHPAYCMTHASRNFDGVRPGGQPGLTDAAGSPVYSAFFEQSSFARHALVQQDNAVPVPDHVSFAEAAPLGCGIQTGAGAVLRSFDAQAGEPIVVFGCGAVGLAAVMAARARDCDPIIAVEPHGERRALALRFGATDSFTGTEANLAETLRSLTGGGARYALEGVGKPLVYATAIECLRPGGICGTLAYPGEFGAPVAHPGGFAFMNTTQIGIIEGDSDPARFIPELIALADAGDLPYRQLIEPYPFARINDALADAAAGHVVKAVLTFD
jgi:aryl-alcohol dehydrogenase